jgi:hypothetical protein
LNGTDLSAGKLQLLRQKKCHCSADDKMHLLLQSLNLQIMENTDLLNGIAGGLAIAIFIGGLLMMFTTFWTTKKK